MIHHLLLNLNQQLASSSTTGNVNLSLTHTVLGEGVHLVHGELDAAGRNNLHHVLCKSGKVLSRGNEGEEGGTSDLETLGRKLEWREGGNGSRSVSEGDDGGVGPDDVEVLLPGVISYTVKDSVDTLALRQAEDLTSAHARSNSPP